MSGKTIMIQGTSSGVGKTLIAAGLCRLLNDAGYKVAPFQPENILAAEPADVTTEGLEVVPSLLMQAEAARVAPRMEMNPVVLKPLDEKKTQVVLQGKLYGDFTVSDYREKVTPVALQAALEALDDLRRDFDMVVIEGAGNPAEANLRGDDIANMQIARRTETPVLLVGEIERGGCLAAIVGTLELLEPEERGLIKGLIITKYRGDLSVLQPDLDFLTRKTGIPVLGAIPYLTMELPKEDPPGGNDYHSSLAANTLQALSIGVVRLPRISNFTDFDALAAEPGVAIRYIENPNDLDSCDLVILPGTKNTTADMAWLRGSGLAAKIMERAGQVIIYGIGGGYQMLGEEIRDPYHLESDFGRIDGLGLLPIISRFDSNEKTVRQVKAYWTNLAGEPVAVTGYEIHQGINEIKGRANFFQLDSGAKEGCRIGNIMGTYLHGCFDNDQFRREFLNQIRIQKGLATTPTVISKSIGELREESYQALAKVFRESLDTEAIFRMAGLHPDGATG